MTLADIKDFDSKFLSCYGIVIKQMPFIQKIVIVAQMLVSVTLMIAISFEYSQNTIILLFLGAAVYIINGFLISYAVRQLYYKKYVSSRYKKFLEIFSRNRFLAVQTARLHVFVMKNKLDVDDLNLYLRDLENDLKWEDTYIAKNLSLSLKIIGSVGLVVLTVFLTKLSVNDYKVLLAVVLLLSIYLLLLMWTIGNVMDNLNIGNKRLERVMRNYVRNYSRFEE